MHPLHPHDPPRVGPYRLHARLGEDVHTRAYLASAPERPAATLKVVRSEYTSDPAFLSAFAREVSGARGLDSSYVAPVLDADTDRATPWVSVARPVGPSLAALVAEHGPLPTEALRPLALALAQGLADVHASGRAHGALWPDHVLLSTHSAVIDPGFAGEDVRLRAPHPSFAAPEGGTGPATDVFAWAATLCLAASGVEGPSGLPRVPPELRGLIDTCLRNDPHLRPNAADLVRMLGGPIVPPPWPDDVAQVIDRSGDAMRHALSPEAPKPRRRAPLVLALAAAGLAVATVAGVFLWPSPTDEADENAIGPSNTPDPDAACLDGTGFDPPSEDIEDLDAMSVAFSPDGDLLAVTSNHHGLTLWDWEEGEEIARPLDEVHEDGQPVFSPVGCMLAVLAPLGTGDSSIVLPPEVPPVAVTVNVPSGTVAEYRGPQNEPYPAIPDVDVSATAFSPDGLHLALGMGLTNTPVGDERALGLIDLATGELTESWGQSRVIDLAHLDDGRLLALDSDGVTAWDTDTGEATHTERGSTSSHLAVVPGTSEFLHVRNGNLIWWDLDARTEVASFVLDEYQESDGTYLTHVTLDHAAERVHIGWAVHHGSDRAWNDPEFSGRESDHHGHLWDPGTDEDLLADDDPDHLVRSLAHHPDGEVIAAITAGGGVDLVDPATLETIRPLQ